MKKNKTSRRQFLLYSTALASHIALPPRRLLAAPPSERVRVGIIGGGQQGKKHLESLLPWHDVEIAYVCDVDRSRLGQCVEQSGGAAGVTDLRRLLDDASLDAVTIATPDHWHTPAALLALAAGKHVYVEKPCSHNVLEGQMLVRASAQQGKVVAHGTQSRSSPGFQEAMQRLHEGLIGEVLVAKCWNNQKRRDIGHQMPSDPPDGVDYDTWVGPAGWLPFQANRFHYDWHWWHNFGCGGMGNDGAHELDYALWGLGVDSHPSTISALGGKYFFDDDQQFPDTQQVTFEFKGEGDQRRRMLIYEQRLWSTTYPFNVDSGVEFYGTQGKMFISKRGKLEVWGERNRRLELEWQHQTKAAVSENMRNWIDCIKSGDLPNASIDMAHRVATSIHLGNIATRLGRTLRFDPAAEVAVGDERANSMLSRTYRKGGHWSVPVDLVRGARG